MKRSDSGAKKLKRSVSGGDSSYQEDDEDDGKMPAQAVPANPRSLHRQIPMQGVGADSSSVGGGSFRSLPISGDEIQPPLEGMGVSTSTEPVLNLDGIWQRDLASIDLPVYVQAHSTTISFPEKLMLMLIHIERNLVKAGKQSDKAPISWILDGRAFVIRERDDLVRKWFPMFFRQGKFQSFTRKLYRWGFRQRDRWELMAHMRSVTAAGLRRQQQSTQSESVATRPANTLSNTSRASDSIIQPPSGIVLPQIPPPSTLPTPSQLGLLAGRQASLPGFDSLQNQALLNQQFSQYVPQLGLATQIGLPQLDPQIQQQLMLAALLNSAQGQSLAPNVLLSNQSFGGLLAASAAAASAASGSRPTSQPEQQQASENETYLSFLRGNQNQSTIPSLSHSQISSYPFASLLALAGNRSETSQEQKQAPENEPDPHERLRQVAELLLRRSNPDPRNPTSGDHQGQSGA